MTEAIIVALITAVCSVVSVIITQQSSARKIYASLDKNQAVTDVKIENLTNEVRTHNNFAQKIPVLQNELDNLKDRVAELEKGGKNGN